MPIICRKHRPVNPLFHLRAGLLPLLHELHQGILRLFFFSQEPGELLIVGGSGLDFGIKVGYQLLLLVDFPLQAADGFLRLLGAPGLPFSFLTLGAAAGSTLAMASCSRMERYFR